MSPSDLPNIPSFRKQHLLLEYASLKLRCPRGIYISLNPGNPSSWSGVFFVRTGPYCPAVLRFNVSFPSQYPDDPPLVTFATDIFHPLLVPLTTYTFSTSAGDANDTVSASDEDRLPPGGFSLRDGFPEWFARGNKAGCKVMDLDRLSQRSGYRSSSASRDVSVGPADVPLDQETVSMSRPAGEIPSQPVAIVDVLAYLQSAFEDPVMLDRLPLEAAGNPGAWHAWQSHRGLSQVPDSAVASESDRRSSTAGRGPPKLPDKWNWEGVWENRVKSGIQHSLSDPVLFGNKDGRPGDKRAEMIRFSRMDPEQLKEICDTITDSQNTGSKPGSGPA
ncbi:hypothetical protein GJ744_007274 [Endocarpon pusillum]|uniref:UBC core domain-containing protein n=1 Tax=Endocarpon pusillum TaxID=364733 RepID=A0A8H7ARS0_9EURO|nr:hypothetical protein GJ744_007274 [Endocarpon pusillum]